MSDDLVKRARLAQFDTGAGLYGDLSDRIEELEAENHLLKTSGIAEVAARNPSVMEYMRHWEGRAEAAEAKLAKAVEALEKMNVGEGWAAQIARTTLAELTGGKDEDEI